VLISHPSVSDAGIMELHWYFARLSVIVEMRGDMQEHLGCPEVLFNCSFLQLQVSLC
jgi:hypothetical protein